MSRNAVSDDNIYDKLCVTLRYKLPETQKM